MKKYFKIVLMILAIGSTTTLVYGQDGEGLFKAKCSACHMVDKNSTGPILKGVKQKWEDAGEGDLIYKWVTGPEALILSGNSQMANAIKDYSPTMMNNQEVSNEEVDAILDYIDTYVAAVEPEVVSSPDGAVSPVITYVPNYKQNLKLFWWLLAASAILLFAIFMMSGSVRTLLNSDVLKQKLIEQKGNSKIKNVLVLIGVFGLIAASNTASAITFNGPGLAEEGAPWLLIENSDLYILIAVNLVLVGVLFYVRGLFKDFMNIINPPVPKEVVETAAIGKKLNKILNDTVEIEDEASILMDHEYDGIQELDNNLPPWWVWMFYATIFTAVIYIFNYHILGTGDLQIEAYNKEMVESKKDIDAYLSKMAMNVDETNATLMTEASDIKSGKGIFEINCVSCHKANGQGDIGPNLTDNFWLYGNDIKNLFSIVKKGNANGMPEHASKLNPIQIQQVTSFVLSMPFAEGKEPQGTEIKE